MIKLTQDQLYTKQADIKGAITEVKTKGSALQLELQKIACSLILHSGEHKDSRFINSTLDQLFHDMPDSFRKDAMAQFLVKYGNLVITEEQQGDKTIEVLRVDTTKGIKLGEALENAWWKAKKPASLKPYDFMDAMEKALKVAQAKVKLNVKEGSNIHAVTQEQVNTMRTAIATLKEPLNSQDSLN